MSEEQTALNNVLDNETQKVKPEKAPEEDNEEQKPAEEQEEPAEETQEAESAPEEEQEPQEAEKEEEPQEAEETATEEKAEEKPKEEPKKQEPKKEKPGEKRKPIGNNVVLVGKKPTMSYVLAAVTQFSDGLNQIHIKARGRSISRAVDVAEVVRNRFVQDLKTDVNIGTQEVTDDNNNKINVSTIDIVLNK
jgi:DNA-binding protein